MTDKRGSKPGEYRGGRPPGTPNKSNAATRDRIEREADPIGFLTRIMHGEAIEASPAKEGDKAASVVPTLDQRMSAARLLADKLVASARPTLRRIRLDLPAVKKVNDALAAHDVILAAMGAGDVSPDEAAMLASVVNAKVAAIETTELEARLAALEAAQGGKDGGR